MTQIKQNYSRYRISDWITLVIGVILAFIQIWRYTHNQFTSFTVEIFVAIVWILLIVAPKTLNDVIRKKYGN